MAGGEATFEDNLAYSRYDPGPIGPSDPAQVVAAFHGASNVQVTNANINVVGGDSHTHMHYHVTTKFKDLKAFLDVIFNVRKIQQDTLAKATPGTVKWLFVSKYFGVWWNRSGTMKILWGSGIPGAGKTILA
ncbi:hypothetical protein BKA70DRAFT_1292974 [Coprinopsis sp. MPI-PUGE-AT-0042]|nr:hypothetical protein BKA70DRAFT_1292974 [Coprinopsis sp. MPI-PUGE-AT-0042]